MKNDFVDMDIPNQFKVILNELGYKTLYPPQEEAIKRGLLDGKNIQTVISSSFWSSF